MLSIGTSPVNSLPNDKTMDWLNFKEFADDNLNGKIGL